MKNKLSCNADVQEKVLALCAALRAACTEEDGEFLGAMCRINAKANKVSLSVQTAGTDKVDSAMISAEYAIDDKVAVKTATPAGCGCA
jgi:hypothetical protein